MTFSSLISGTFPHHNKCSSRQGRAITDFLPHHWAGLGGGIERMTNANDPASVNYIITSDGLIFGQVPEEYRAWTSGSFEADAPAITVEVQNSGGQLHGNDDHADSWQISLAAQASLIRLGADIARRYGFGALTLTNWDMHRFFYATACPGGFMMANRPRFIASANAQLGLGSQVVPATPPVAGKSVWQLANEVLAGKHGNGADRQKSLGSQYASVQAEIDRRLGVGGAGKAPLAQKSVGQLADEVIAGAHGSGAARQKSLGSRFNEVQAEVNRKLGAARPTVVNAPKSISQLADEVLQGKHGNGAARQKSLGGNFNAVQAEINRRMGATGQARKSVAQLADEVLAGKHGNGDARVRSLGANFAAVQAEINRRYGG